MKEVAKNTAVNVIYLTTACNFACKYCYEELEGKQIQRMSKNEIKNAVDTILEREPKNEQTLFVLFGGEVFLEWENAKFFMDYAFSKKTNVFFNFETNGYKFKSDNFIKKVQNNIHFRAKRATIDISFDGVGNSERILKNGKDTTPVLLNVFKKLKLYNFPFRLRYTIHNKNVNFLKQDLYNIMKYINPKRIIVSIDYSSLTSEQLNKINIIKTEIANDFKYGKIQTPVCEFCCNVCTYCSSTKENHSYFSKDGNINNLKLGENHGAFKDF